MRTFMKYRIAVARFVPSLAVRLRHRIQRHYSSHKYSTLFRVKAWFTHVR